MSLQDGREIGTEVRSGCSFAGADSNRYADVLPVLATQRFSRTMRRAEEDRLALIADAKRRMIGVRL